MAVPAERLEETIERLEEELLQLPGEARARIVQKLIFSLDGEGEDEIETAWYDEAERRVREYRASGEVPQPLEEVLAELRSGRA